MRLPRDWSGEDLIKRLRRYGYEPTRQTGSHVRLTRQTGQGEYHVTVPLHSSLRVGTLNNILSEVANQLDKSKQDLLAELLR